MVEAYEKVGGNLVAALEVPDSETHKYGVIDPGATDGRLTEIRGLVEKPAPGTAPSNLMLPGRYILQPEVMLALDAQEKGAGGKKIPAHRRDRQAGRAAAPRLPVQGRTLRLRKCGRLRGCEIVAVALQREDVAPAVKEFLSRTARTLRPAPS